jgi:putative ABC transport system permease protein
LILEQLLDPINFVALLICAVAAGAAIVYVALQPKLALLILKNLGRSPVRTALISLAVVVLVAMVTLIWTVVFFLDQTMVERSKDLKLIVTERWQLPSQMPVKHADYLDPKSPSQLSALKGLYGPNDFMTWSFYGGYTDPTKKAASDIVFFFVMDPDCIKTMMDDLEDYDDATIAKLKATRTGCLMGRDRLKNLNKKVGEKFKITSLNYPGIDLELEIVGELPAARFGLGGIMRSDYFLGAFDKYERDNGQQHPLMKGADRRLNLVWLRVPDRDTFSQVAAVIENDPHFDQRPVRVDTASSGIASFLEAYQTLLVIMKFFVVPIILIIMSLVVALAISIGIRERRTEIAVMKVLGYRPNQVLYLVLGESLLMGAIAGLFAAGAMFLVVNVAMGGIPFPIAFFPAFTIPIWALAWGPAMGILCAFVGCFVPAWQARSVRVSEVFSRVE